MPADPLMPLFVAASSFLLLAHIPDPPDYRIETIAGNGTAGDIPASGGSSRELSVDLPFGVENGPDGGLFITTVGTHRVLRLERGTGQLQPVVGNGRRGYSGDGGPALEATLNEPYEVRFDSKGNMLIVEMQNHLVRRVDAASRTISTVAGDGVAGYRGDGGPARDARFRDPHSICLDDHDNIYVSDLANHRVRRIDATSGIIETLAGNGQRGLPQDDGIAKEQPFLTPQGIAVRGNDLWIASVSGHSVWRLDLQTGRIHRVVGSGKAGHTGDGGNPLDATFDGPRGITLTTSGVLYVVEGENNIIRAVDTVHGSIRTIAGVGREQHTYAGDGIVATTAPLSQPHGVCVSKNGSLVISDTKNHRVRTLVPTSR
jgi:sugar lactone lactonase YvrE